MKAILEHASYSPKTEEYTCYGFKNYLVVGPTAGMLRFTCFDKQGHTMSLEMDGVGVPRLNPHCDYDVEIKITEIPKSVPKEYIIK